MTTAVNTGHAASEEDEYFRRPNGQWARAVDLFHNGDELLLGPGNSLITLSMAGGQNADVSSLFRESFDGARDKPAAEERERLLADE